jgi:hypothetical protein
MGETLAAVEFFQRGQQTEIVLTHSRFPSEEIRNRHT